MRKLLIILCAVLIGALPLGVFAVEAEPILETTADNNMSINSIVVTFADSAKDKEVSVLILYPNKTILDIEDGDVLDTVAFSTQRKLVDTNVVVAEIDGATGDYSVYYDYAGCPLPKSTVVHFVNREDNKNALIAINNTVTDPESDETDLYDILTTKADDLCFENEFEDIVDLTKVAKRMYDDIESNGLLNVEEYNSAAEVYNRACLLEAIYAGASVDFSREAYVTALNLTECSSFANWYTPYNAKSKAFNAEISKRMKGREIADLTAFASVFDEAVVTSVVYMPDGAGNVKKVMEAYKSFILGDEVELTSREAVYLNLSGDTYMTYAELAQGYAAEKSNTSAVVPAPGNRPSGGGGGGGGGVGGMKVDTPAKGDGLTDLSSMYPNIGYDGTAGNYPDVVIVPWAKEAISDLSARGILAGDDNGNFNPERFVTREEFAKILVMAFGMTDKEGEMNFTDVSTNDWYYDYVKVAYANGVISGMGDSFGVGYNITRQDMAVMIMNAMTVAGKTSEAAELSYNDNGNIADYAKEAVSKMINAGIMKDIGNGYFNPNGLVTRAHAAKAIYLAIK